MEMTQNITNIFEALCKFRGEVVNPKKDKVNPHFKSEYASLDSIITAVNPVLSQCGLSFLQDEVYDRPGYVGVYTMLIHKTGEWIKLNPVYIKLENEHPQKKGAALTYAKRYSLSMALGIATDEDDDANSVEPPEQKPQKKIQPEKNQPKHETKNATENVIPLESKATTRQINAIHAIASKKGLEDDQLRDLMRTQFGKESSKALTRQDASDLIELMQKTDLEELVLLIEANKALEGAK